MPPIEPSIAIASTPAPPMLTFPARRRAHLGRGLRPGRPSPDCGRSGHRQNHPGPRAGGFGADGRRPRGGRTVRRSWRHAAVRSLARRALAPVARRGGHPRGAPRERAGGAARGDLHGRGGAAAAAAGAGGFALGPSRQHRFPARARAADRIASPAHRRHLSRRRAEPRSSVAPRASPSARAPSVNTCARSTPSRMSLPVPPPRASPSSSGSSDTVKRIRALDANTSRQGVERPVWTACWGRLLGGTPGRTRIGRFFHGLDAPRAGCYKSAHQIAES
ncbi:MAG: hypothetical protein QOF33_3008 [Thermomicrobiales bacterium]|nr:hypothetical protein [Thermomicrobiales bacterium]